MPTYNLTVSTEFKMQTEANSPEEAVQSLEAIANDENGFVLSVVSVEQARPQIDTIPHNEYVSLKSFHHSQQHQEHQQQNDYNRFVTQPTVSSFYTRLVPFIR
jgi:hypothetical protein